MHCDKCKSEDKTLCLAPDEPGCKWLCMDCIIELGLYCVKHDQVHATFAQGGHACIPCIEEAVTSMVPEAEVVAAQIKSIAGQSDDKDELSDLNEWAETAAMIIGDTARSKTILRAVLTHAARRNMKYDDIISEAAQKRSIRDLLPSYFYL